MSNAIYLSGCQWSFKCTRSCIYHDGPHLSTTLCAISNQSADAMLLTSWQTQKAWAGVDDMLGTKGVFRVLLILIQDSYTLLLLC